MLCSRSLYIALALQIAILGLVGLATLGFDVPILRQIVGFAYLTFVPGFLLLKVFRLNRLGIIETLLYSVGLSIAFVMFIGLLINMLFPLVGISRPISILPVIGTISVIVLVLYAIAYRREIRERESLSRSYSIGWSELFSPQVLLLILLPTLAALGTLWVYSYQDNIVLLVLLLLVALVAILVAFDKFFPVRLYPVIIVAIGLSLLWHWSLISMDLNGFDINAHYWTQSVVLNNSFWDLGITTNMNAMLSNVMLPPIYSIVLDLDTVWIFKIIYPVFFCLVPLTLFQVYRKQLNDKVAFFATFFFMSMPVFFIEASVKATQPIAELFVVLSILLFVTKEISAIKRTILLIIFGTSIVVSHYGLAYIYIFYLLTALALSPLLKRFAIGSFWGIVSRKSTRLRQRVRVAFRSQGLEYTFWGRAHSVPHM